MLKTIRSSDKLVSRKNNGNRSASSLNNGNNEINRFGVNNDSMEYTKKLRKSKSQKLSKSPKLKGEKLFKSQKSKREKLFKSKKPSKIRNLPQLDVREIGSSFLTPNTRITFKPLTINFY